MTTEEAIEIITLMCDMARNSVSTNTSNADALDMAISAIKNEQTDGDLISRQAVIDMLNRLIEVERKQGTDVMNYGRERVNAYESILDEIESDYLFPSIMSTEKTDGDLISRQAVIGIVEFECGEWKGLAKTIVKAIEQLPSEEKTASLVALDDYPSEDWECDNCGYTIAGVVEPYRFCPNCGKKMWK